MDNEKLLGMQLKEQDLEKVTGGSTDKPSCQYYIQVNAYKTCPNPLMGICKQCSGCNLNEA